MPFSPGHNEPILLLGMRTQKIPTIPCSSLCTQATRKMVPITGRASSFHEIFCFYKLQSQSKLYQNQIKILKINFFCCSSFLLCLQAQATIFSSLAFLSSSVSMANLSHLVAVSFSGLALLSSSVSTPNLSCMLATTFSTSLVLVFYPTHFDHVTSIF